jgi:hypothetical protein
MARWDIITGPREYNPSGGSVGRGSLGRDLGWGYVIERGNERLTVRVECDTKLAESDVQSGVVRCAVASRGRSAVEAILSRERPPPRLIVTADGIAERVK